MVLNIYLVLPPVPPNRPDNWELIAAPTGSASIATSSAGGVATTPSPTPVSAAGDAPPPTAVGSPAATESPEGTGAGGTEAPVPEPAEDIPATPSPGAFSLSYRPSHQIEMRHFVLVASPLSPPSPSLPAYLDCLSCLLSPLGLSRVVGLVLWRHFSLPGLLSFGRWGSGPKKNNLEHFSVRKRRPTRRAG